MAAKKKTGPQYVAINECDETCTRGSKEDVIEMMNEWIDRDPHLDEHHIRIFKLGEEIKIEIEATRKIYFVG